MFKKILTITLIAFCFLINQASAKPTPHLKSIVETNTVSSIDWTEVYNNMNAYHHIMAPYSTAYTSFYDFLYMYFNGFPDEASDDDLKLGVELILDQLGYPFDSSVVANIVVAARN